MTKKRHRQLAELYANSNAGHWTRRILKEMRQSTIAADWFQKYIGKSEARDRKSFQRSLLKHVK